jgi:hypothetical protein
MNEVVAENGVFLKHSFLFDRAEYDDVTLKLIVSVLQIKYMESIVDELLYGRRAKFNSPGGCSSRIICLVCSAS